MILKKNEWVLFEDGHKECYLEARWSDKYQSFYSFIEIEDENGFIKTKKIFSNKIITEKRKKRTYKKQTDISKMKEIFPIFETQKAYAVEDGTNGCISKGNIKVFYKYYAKSICVEKDGKIYAPMWAK